MTGKHQLLLLNLPHFLRTTPLSMNKAHSDVPPSVAWRLNFAIRTIFFVYLHTTSFDLPTQLARWEKWKPMQALRVLLKRRRSRDYFLSTVAFSDVPNSNQYDANAARLQLRLSATPAKNNGKQMLHVSVYSSDDWCWRCGVCHGMSAPIQELLPAKQKALGPRCESSADCPVAHQLQFWTALQRSCQYLGGRDFACPSANKSPTLQLLRLTLRNGTHYEAPGKCQGERSSTHRTSDA